MDDPYDLSQLAVVLGAIALEYRPEVESTNTWALEMARDVNRNVPFLALTARQTGGRGRGNNRWWSSDGAATFSLALDPAAMAIPPERCGQVALATGVAVADSLASAFPEGDFAVKWPNDVYLFNRKVCGILVESIGAPGSRAVVGVGININNSLAGAPREVVDRAITLSDAARARFDMSEVVGSASVAIVERIAALAHSPERMLARLRERCWLTGKVVAISTGQRTIQGRCAGIDDRGGLVLNTAQGAMSLMAGVVVSVENDA